MIEYDIMARLAADGTVAGLVGTRVYVAHLPQGATFPALVVSVVSGAPEYQMEGQAGVADVRLQIDAFAHGGQTSDDAYDDMRQLAEAVRTSLSGIRETVGSSDVQSSFLLNRRVIYEEAVDVYREIQDWQIGYAES